jgi:hypothetical protein
MSGGFQRAVTTMALEKKKAAKDLAATKKAVKESAATERKKKKKEPTANSSIKASSVSGSPLKDKSNEDNSNVHPSKKGITIKAEIGTKLHSVIPNYSEIIAELNTALKQANVKSDEKDEQLQSSMARNSHLQTEIESLVTSNNESVHQISVLKGDLSAKEIMINDIGRLLDEKSAEIALVHEQLQVAKDKITKLEQEAATQQRHAHPSTPSKSLWGSRNGDSFNIPPISSTPSFVPTPINFFDEEWKQVGNLIKLEIAPWRSLSSEDGYLSLGANGYLIFEENLVNINDVDVRTGAIRSREPRTVRRVSYYNTNQDLMFMAELPKRKLLKDIQGNAGVDFMFAWDVVNQAHGFHRRYVFAFPSKTLLSVVLYRIFYDNQQLMEEFFIVNGRNRFYAKEANVPAHKVVTTESDMDIDRPKAHRPGYTSEQYQMELGVQYDVFDETQRS